MESQKGKERNGKKVISKRQHKNVKYEVYIANFTTFKTIQIRITGRIHINKDNDPDDYRRLISLTKTRIKNIINTIGRTGTVFQEVSIVDINTPELTKKLIEEKSSQFFKIDVVLFVKPGNTYDKYLVTLTSENVVSRIYDTLLMIPDIWDLKIIQKRKTISIDAL